VIECRPAALIAKVADYAFRSIRTRLAAALVDQMKILAITVAGDRSAGALSSPFKQVLPFAITESSAQDPNLHVESKISAPWPS
jgi:hypothetical protein